MRLETSTLTESTKRPQTITTSPVQAPCLPTPHKPPPGIHLHHLLEYLPKKELPILGKIYPFFGQTTILYCADYSKKISPLFFCCL